MLIIAAFFLLRISESRKLKGDSAIALISTSSLAVGVMVISMTTGMNTDVYNYMFGSILAMSAEDVRLMKAAAGKNVKVKASGGIRTREDFDAMVAAGATRIGASAGVKIIEGK